MEKNTKDLLEWMKNMYIKSYDPEALNWKLIHPNNMIQNSQDGEYAILYIPDPSKNKYDFYKFSIGYEYRVDEQFVTHPAEGIMCYTLHIMEARGEDGFDMMYSVPDPTKDFSLLIFTDSKRYYEQGYLPPSIINDYGRFKAVFIDMITAKKACLAYLRRIIYPYGYILSDEDQIEFNKFVNTFREENKLD